MTFLVLVAQVFLAAPPAAGTAASPGVWWSKQLELSSLAQLDDRLRKPLKDLPKVVVKHDPPRLIQSCAELLDVSHQRFRLDPDDAVSWRGFESEGAPCFALDALRGAKPPTRSYVGWFTLSPGTVAKLPPGMTLSFSADDLEDIAVAAKKCQPLGAYEDELHVQMQGPDQADIKTAAWSGRIVLYARGDLNGDGLEDLMFLRQAQANEGTAADSTVFIVTQRSAHGCLQIVRTLPEGLGTGGRRAR